MLSLKKYSLSDKYKYFCAMSRPGAKKANGKLVSDFERGRFFERALMIKNSATIYNKSKKSEKMTKSRELDMNTRDYSDEELNLLFDNLKDIGLKDIND